MEASVKLYVLFFAISVVLWALALVLYGLVTPVRELKLIGQGNRAAACSLGGAALGLAVVIGACSTITDVPRELAIWAALAALFQILAFVVVALILPGFRQGISQDKTSYGIFLGALSLAIGLLNAGALIIK
jgi:putative membrane protein